MFPLVTPSYAAGLLLAHTLVWKLAMTALFRLKLTDGRVPKAEVDKIASSQMYLRWWAAQKNEAEYAGIFVAYNLYLAATGQTNAWATTLQLVGQALYTLPRAVFGHYHEGGPVRFPGPYVPGAVIRYAGLGLATYGLLA